VLLLPLGDLLENRLLSSRTLLVTALALALAAFAPNLGAFLVLSIFIGLTSVVAQILIPLAAHLAPEAERGQFVGRVMSGLLLGILLARTASSLLAAAFGWRSVYVVSAVLMLGTAVVLARMLPNRKPDHTASYPQLLRSVLQIAKTEPRLRQRALGQAMMFMAFSSFWTSISFQLIKTHDFSQVGIAIFALVGDRGHGRIGSGVSLLLAATAMGLAATFGSNVGALVVSAVLLDLAVQSHQVLSQREIYALRADARARINTVFMGTVFLGGAIGSAVSGALYEAHGWRAAALFGGAMPLIGFLLWLRRQLFDRDRAAARPAAVTATASS
jgi:predicted MFS family arabinose efflux permease